MSFLGGGNDSNEQTTTTQSQPWQPAQASLITGLGEAANQWQNLRPAAPLSTVAPQNPYQLQALQGVANRAVAGSPLLSGAQQQTLAQATGSPLANPAIPMSAYSAGGGYLGSNPFLSGMFDAASADITRAYREATAPQTNAQFTMTGGLRGAGPAYNEAVARNENELARNLSRLGANIYGGAYNLERGLQENAMARLGGLYGTGLDQSLRAAALAPSMADIDYSELGRLYGVGNTLQQQRERELAGAREQQQWYQMGPGSEYGALDTFLGRVLPIAGMGTAASQRYQVPDTTAQNLLAGGLAGAGVANMIEGVEPFSGAAGWALPIGGALLGGLF